jgi:DNA-binding MarR family transcriptional regulator
MIDRSVTHLLHRAGQASQLIFSSKVTVDITPRQLVVLVAVSEGEGINQTQLVERTGIDRSTIAEMVMRMVKKGLLHRRRSREDSRAKVLRLTDEGQQLLAVVGPIAMRVDQLLLAALPNSRRAPFLQALQQVVSEMEALPRTPRPSTRHSPARSPHSPRR